MPKRFPEWVNTEVVIKAIKMREEGMLSKQLNLWIENLLEIEKSKFSGNTFNDSYSGHCCSISIIYVHNCKFPENNLITYYLTRFLHFY